MTKIIALIKFIASGLIILGILVGLIFSFDKSSETLVTVIAALLSFVFGGLYSYYLIKTGIWNLKDRPYSISFLLIIGLLIHFMCSGLLLFYSQRLFPSTQIANNLLFTTMPFFIIAIAVGLYDIMQFYKTWKTHRLKS